MGIDYGMGRTNIDHETGIRYGVIPAHDVGQSWYDSAEPYYGEPHCPKCGNKAIKGEHPEHTENYDCSGCGDYRCDDCEYMFDGEEAFGEEAISYSLDDGEIIATQSGDDCDIFIIKSPFYTFAPFCSPCAPGACYLRDGSAEGDAKAYCFPSDWFSDDSPCSYPVYRVTDNVCVYMPESEG